MSIKENFSQAIVLQWQTEDLQAWEKIDHKFNKDREEVQTYIKSRNEACQYHKSPFNAIDYIAEMLWNLNPRHPERKENPLYLFDMEWVIERLKVEPRPYFPFSWIWSKEYAATKIQAYMRGHWVRRRPEVQEVRQFWKVIKKEMEGDLPSRLPSILWPCLPFYEAPEGERKSKIEKDEKE